jgi:LPXTG-motif cell wall-anchored protein
MSRITLAVAGVLAIVCAAPALAEVMDLQPVTPIQRVEPVVLGYVTAVGTHSVNVDVPRSEAMMFEFDSRTVMPRELQTGTPVRIDFRLLDNGMHFANRVTPILPGSNDWRAIENMRVSQQMTPDPATVVAVTETTPDEPVVVEVMDPAASKATTTTSDVASTPMPDPNAADQRANHVSSNADAGNRLPQTASELPLLLMLGSASVAGAIALSIRRRRRA